MSTGVDTTFMEVNLQGLVEAISEAERMRAALLRLRDLLDAAIPQVGPGELLRIVKRGLGEEVAG